MHQLAITQIGSVSYMWLQFGMHNHTLNNLILVPLSMCIQAHVGAKFIDPVYFY